VSAIRFFTDEDLHGAVAPQLRALGIDAVSTPEVGRLGADDASQFRFATNESRVLVTFNVTHFAKLHYDWIRAGDHHAGLVVSSQRTVGDTLRRLHNLAQALSAAQMANRLEYLSNW
jgi:hypothetical protein